MADAAKYTSTFQYGRNGSYNPPVSPYWAPPEYDLQPSSYFIAEVNLSASALSQAFSIPPSFGTLTFMGIANRGSANCSVTYTCTTAGGTSTTNKQVVLAGGSFTICGKVDVTQPVTVAGEDGAAAVTTVELIAVS